MEKILLNSNKTLPIIDALTSIFLFKEMYPDLESKDVDIFKNIFLDKYTNETFYDYPTLVLEVANKCMEEGIGINIDDLKTAMVYEGIFRLNIEYTFHTNTNQIRKMYQQKVENLYLFDKLYIYFEENLKKIIISEVIKRLYSTSPILPKFKIRITKERLYKIYEGETVDNKSNIFLKQLQIWTMYNGLVGLIMAELKKDEILIIFSFN